MLDDFDHSLKAERAFSSPTAKGTAQGLAPLLLLLLPELVHSCLAHGRNERSSERRTRPIGSILSQDFHFSQRRSQPHDQGRTMVPPLIQPLIQVQA